MSRRRVVAAATAVAFVTLLSGCVPQSLVPNTKSVAYVSVTSGAIETYNSHKRRLTAESFAVGSADFLKFLTATFGPPKHHSANLYSWDGLQFSTHPNEVTFSRPLVDNLPVLGNGKYRVGRTFPTAGSNRACFPGSPVRHNNFSFHKGEGVTIVSKYTDATKVASIVAPFYYDGC